VFYKRQELLFLLEHLSAPPVFWWVRVAQNLVLNVTFIYIFSYFISFFKYIRIKIINLENTEWAIKNGQLATYGTQDEEKQKKNTT
jgi:cytochrome b subunit of formate dehydrogenase